MQLYSFAILDESFKIILNFNNIDNGNFIKLYMNENITAVQFYLVIYLFLVMQPLVSSYCSFRPIGKILGENSNIV